MAKLEFYRQQVVPRIATPSARGLAAIESPLAQVATSVAQGATAISKLTEDLNQLRAEDAFNKLRTRQTDLMMNPESGFMSRRAADAVAPDFMSRYVSDFDKEVETISQGLQNPQQRELFTRRAAMAKAEYSDSLMRHVLGETRQYNDDVYTGAVSTEVNSASLNWRDPAKIKDSIARVASNTALWADRRGLTGDALLAAQVDNATSIHSAVINSALDSGDVSYATKYLDQNRSMIRADRLAEIENKISNETAARESVRIADDVMFSFRGRMPTETEVRQAVREKAGDNVDVRNTATQEALAQLASMQRDKSQLEDQVLDSVYRQLETNGYNYMALPASLRAAIPGDKIGLVRNYADTQRAGKVVKTTDQGWSKYNELKTNPVLLRNTDLMQYRPILGDTEFKDLVNEKSNIANDPDAIIAQIDTINGLLDQKFKEIGVNPNSKVTRDVVRIGQAKAVLRQNLDALAIEKGRKLNPTEIELVVNRLFLDPVIQDTWYTREKKIFPFEVTQATSPVPQSDREAIVKALEATGTPVNEANIYNYWKLKNPQAED